VLSVSIRDADLHPASGFSVNLARTGSIAGLVDIEENRQGPIDAGPHAYLVTTCPGDDE
jgi:hypothetical protein